jgi:hypothetical protein
LETDPPHERNRAVRHWIRWYVDHAEAARAVVAPAERWAEPGRADRVRFASAEEAEAWYALELDNAVAALRQAHDAGLTDLYQRLAAAVSPYIRRESQWNSWLAERLSDSGRRPG